MKKENENTIETGSYKWSVVPRGVVSILCYKTLQPSEFGK